MKPPNPDPENPVDVLIRRFILGAVGILLTTGTAKVWSGLGSARLLAVADPIVGIEFRHLMLVAGFAEIAIAIFCTTSRRQVPALGLLAWLATNFLLYRLGLWWMGWHRPCSCLGNLTDALRISPQAADNAMKAALAYLLVGSCACLMLLWKRGRHPQPPREPAVGLP